MKRELKDVKEVKGDIELNAPSHSYQSSSNASSPIREDDDSKNTNESFRVDDVDMWEVLEALEGAQHTSGTADRDGRFHECLIVQNITQDSPQPAGGQKRCA